MTLGAAASEFLSHEGLTDDTAGGGAAPPANALALFRQYLSSDIALGEITVEVVRDFFARWYVEKAVTDAARLATGTEDAAVESCALVTGLIDFFAWADERFEAGLSARCATTLLELGRTVPRAIELTARLSQALSARGGAFTFPEFLTTFEEGGRSEYDIDTPGEKGVLEGYFRLTRVAGPEAEAEDLNTGRMVGPILFPGEVADALGEDYIINLEIIRKGERWEVASCGFAYPPGTDV